MPKGEPANFLTAAELRAKFDGLAGAVSLGAPARRARRRAARARAGEGHRRVLRLTRPDEAGGAASRRRQ